MKLLITGDFVINQFYNTSQISEEIKNLFAQADYNIVNLEAPVTENNLKILKTGPHLKANKKNTLEVLKSLDINLCTLANNHVLDYDEQGVIDTLDFCRENDIQIVGAGKNKEEAAKIFYLETEVGIIAFINIAENEWASATETSAGANGMDIIEDVKNIQEAKQKGDFVFVIVHGGHEYYNLPSPRMQKQYRFYIDNGADLVVGHHTHCIGGMETYKGKSIYYSLGNFLFTKPSRFEDWYKGIVLEIEITDKKEIKTKPIFVKQEKDDFKLSTISGREENEIQSRFDNYSNIIQDDLSVEWNNFISQKEKMYLNRWSANVFIKNRYLSVLLTKLGLIFSSKKGKATLLNMLRCEAHADLSKASLKKDLT
ncbi:CapA family protein [Xanthomarina gelatinilytica]|uniref:CapA family protein n=1 Tax=Xanthomarina gelatinilytica TaxID=1137281 RepID=UPI003AA7BC57